MVRDFEDNFLMEQFLHNFFMEAEQTLCGKEKKEIIS